MQSPKLQWCSLPKQLWQMIGKFLESPIDLLRFRSVCSLWRSVLPPLDPPDSPLAFPHYDSDEPQNMPWHDSQWCPSYCLAYLNGFLDILKIQKFRRIVSYTGFYCFTAVLSYAYTSNTTRAGFSRGDQFYASYPAGTELLTDQAKLYKAALGNCFEIEEWGPIEYCIMAKTQGGEKTKG